MFSWIKRLIEPSPKPAPLSPLDRPVAFFQTLLGKKTIGIPWRLRHAFEGTLVTGASGSGKTSGSGDFLARAFLEFGMGGLVLCAKPEEAEHWIKLAEKAGRAADLRVVSPEGSYRFNFLDYEMNRPGRGGGITENAVSVLMQCAEIANGAHNRDQDVWERSMKQLLRNSVDLCRLAKEPLKIRTIYRVAVEKGFADQLLMQAEALHHDEADFEDLETVRDYFLKEWVTMAERTRSSIVMTLTSMADPFLRGALRDLFAKDTNLTPEDAFRGKIILIDLPVKEFNEMGRYAGVIWKYLFQRAAERRVGQKLPLFLYADEAQFFVTSTDADFQATARSACVASVYLTQNLANLYARVRKEYVNSLLGNLQTKLFHQNADKETNHWAADTVSKVFFQRESTSVSTRVDDHDESTTTGTSTHLVLDYDLQPRAFLQLAKGGTPYNHVVTAILFQGGRWFPNGKIYIQVAFTQ